MRSLITFFWCLSCTLMIFAQEDILALKAKAHQTADQKELADTYLKLSAQCLNLDVDTSMWYAQKARVLSDSTRDSELRRHAMLLISKGLLMKGNLDSTAVLLKSILDSPAGIDDSSIVAETYYLQGNIEEELNFKDKASDNFFRALGIAKRNNYPQIEADVYNALGSLTMGSGDEQKAIEYMSLGLRVGEDNNLPMVVIRQLINLSVYHDDPDVKTSYLDRAIPLAHEYKHTRALSFAYVAKSHIHEAKAEWPQAIDFLQKAYQVSLQTGDLVKQKQVLLALGKAYVATQNYKRAIEVLQKNLEADSIDILARHDIQVNELLSEIYANNKQYLSAYTYLNTAYGLREINYRQNIEDNLEEANAKFETERKDAEIARQKLELAQKDAAKNRLMGGAAFFILTLGGFFLYYSERQKRKKKEAELALVENQKETEKLKELDELKTQFFTNVSHELRTPLTLILGPLGDVKEKVDNPDVKKSLHLAHSNADRLLTIVNEVLDLSKLQSGQIKTQFSSTPINTFLKRIVHAFDSLAEMRNISIILHTANDNKVVRTDTEKVEKILNNLVSNAIKYSPNDAQIDIHVSMDAQQLKVTVTDHGKGIDPTEVDKIFDRFYQSNIITAVEGGGTGIGLALSRELAELLGGGLVVESQLGYGSSFIMTIPVIVQEEELVEEGEELVLTKHKAYQPILINGEKPHLLIVEDNADMRDYLHSFLADQYRCTFAVDGYEALQKIQTNSFDLISSDIMMPHMDGIQFKTKVNELSEDQRTPFIFLTAKSLEENILQGLMLGVDDYITKPFNKEEYKARIHNLLQNRIERMSSMSANTAEVGKDRSIEEELLRNAELAVKKNLDNPNYKVTDLARELNYSQRQIARIMNELIGMTPVNFILELRLQRAYHLLKSKSRHSVSEVMYDVGIESASYFTRKFTERFGIRPSEV